MIEFETTQRVEADELLHPQPNILIVLTGPTASGKTSIRNALLEGCPWMKPVLNTTNRPPRRGERIGKDMDFVGSEEEFVKMMRQGSLLEVQRYGKSPENPQGFWYGTAKSALNDFFAGKDMIWVLPTQNAIDLNEIITHGLLPHHPARVKFLKERLVRIYIGVPSIAELRNRYNTRATGSPQDRWKRIKDDVKEWVRGRNIFQHVVINETDQFDQTMESISSIIAHHRESVRQKLEHDKIQEHHAIYW